MIRGRKEGSARLSVNLSGPQREKKPGIKDIGKMFLAELRRSILIPAVTRRSVPAYSADGPPSYRQRPVSRNLPDTSGQRKQPMTGNCHAEGAIGVFVILRERSDRRISGCRLAGKKCSEVSVQERRFFASQKVYAKWKTLLLAWLRMISERQLSF
jgi:hypothetical protein